VFLLSLPVGNIAARGMHTERGRERCQAFLENIFQPPPLPPQGALATLHGPMPKTKIQPPEAALLHAVAQAGGQTALARKLKIKPQAVHQWVLAGRVPPLRALAVEAATGVSRKALRPDIYP